ncbi:MAG TPA: SCP2 sterol-binding domain-containing protein [Acidimicrobiales bacterium]|nr:SCP2 sterol-binding domain-containing protein [Acidimicrobiales bacterium]
MDELNQAIADDPELAESSAGVHLTLQQVVMGAGQVDATYAIHIDDGALQVVPGGVEEPDVTFTEDYDTAAALSRGELTAQTALLNGRIRVQGDTNALARGQEALGRAQVCFDRVRERTSY